MQSGNEIQLREALRGSLKSKVLQKEELDFNALALEIFHFQYQYNPVYQCYVQLLGKKPEQIKHLKDIPFLPIESFKQHQIRTGQGQSQRVFESSGTTGQIPSRHEVWDSDFYAQLAKQLFETAYGPLDQFHIFALLPSYLERGQSSLVFMMDGFIRQSQSTYSDFYLHQHQTLLENMERALDSGRKLWLMGVSFALLDLIEQGPIPKAIQKAAADGRLMIMETGGMKGRREEILRDALHARLQSAFSCSHIHSEYGMTELFSQAYAKAAGVFAPANTLKVLIREIQDPFQYHEVLGKTGGINVVDLGNIDSCAFIETQDMGSLCSDRGDFMVLGRMDLSEQRGCNLMLS